jgi:hypothetical protein
MGKPRTNDIMVRLSDEELARLDVLRPSDTARATYLRRLLQEPPSGDAVATRGEALGILTRLARDGRVSAAIALERALREEQIEPGGELARLLRDE